MNHQLDAKTYTDDWDEPQPERVGRDEPAAATRDTPRTPGLVDTSERLEALAPTPKPVPQLASLDAELAEEAEHAEQSPQRVALPTMPRHDPKRSEVEGVWIPALFSRSSLFAAFPEPSGAKNEKRLLTTHGPYTLWLEGPRLDMIDKAAWEVFVQAAWERGCAGEEFELSLGAMARARGVTEGGGNAQTTTASLMKLAKAQISFERRDRTTGAIVVQGKACLLRDLRQLPPPAGPNPRGGAWVASFDKDLARLFQKDLTFESAPKRRAALSTSLARWLHDYFATHKAYEGHKLSELRALCGYGGRKDDFPSLLRKAMGELVELAPGCVCSYKLVDAARSSDKWTLSVERSEAPKHGRDKAELNALMRPKQPVPIEGARRGSKPRGGVAL